MFELEKSYRFEAGHVLKHHNGRCSRPHGHSYRLTVRLRSDSLIASGSSTNMVMDFADVNDIVEPLIDQFLEHHWLNETLDCESATCEYIARWIFQRLKPLLPQLYAVKLSETESSSITYTE